MLPPNEHSRVEERIGMFELAWKVHERSLF